MIQTTFVNGKNPFRVIRRVSAQMTRHAVCNHIRMMARPVTSAEVVQHFDIPMTNVSRLLGELVKEGAISRAAHKPTVAHPDSSTKNVYSYIRESSTTKNDRIGPVLTYLTANPLATLREICDVMGLNLNILAPIMYCAVHKSGTVMCKKVDNRLVYWAAP
jgi:hypothetical protein